MLRLAVCSLVASTTAVAQFTFGDRTFNHEWITKADMLEARSDMTASPHGDAIFLIGGCVKDQEWAVFPWGGSYACGGGLASAVTGRTTAYYPATNTHKNLTDAPRARYRHAAAVVDGKIYLLGGVDGTDTVVKEVDVYNIATGAWTTLSTPWANATTDVAAFAHGGKIYAVGGYVVPAWEAVTTTYIFNPAGVGAGAWSVGPALKQGRGDTFATVIGDSAFVIGGFHHGNNFEFPLETMERLDLAVPVLEWKSREAMEVARGDKAVAAIHGLVHVVGGESKNKDGHSVALSDVEVYDPESNAWKAGGAIPSKRFRFTAAPHGESIFIFGGQGYLDGVYGTTGSKYPVLATVEEYSEKVAVTQLSAAVGIGAGSTRLFACVASLLLAFYSC
eukprot:TRINITY_DN27056_c0_g1_i1.p1 TRINITY_DN27056_c0_g1~~TRINITY_DN27056_c0_g1_i1.p1  ORF type:complete len:391 (-),score=72.86 TRINITY_DN27056_c0_g1_i1:366-1538(-)